ncbi:MAG TPA: hypothetical protein VGQ55_03335 [Pyrinomonadaceae bacterium]|nr:hypothetical protein [Pyrinomonadaceae bacterium]
MTDLEISIFAGTKLNDPADEVGVGLVQLTAQHSLAAFASDDLSLLFALSQHSIIPESIFPACSGMPASTPPARVKSKNKDVNHLFIPNSLYLTI